MFALVLIISLWAPFSGQEPASSPTPLPKSSPSPVPQQQDDEVVRITANLVQVDAVVTDKAGRHVTDLSPEDFEILEDSRPQSITNFSYLPAGGAKPNASTFPVTTARVDRGPAAPVRLRPDQVRRTIALVVDDLGMSSAGATYVRRALRQFVDEQIQPNDLVTIVLTTSGLSSLQGFTSDKQQLSAAIDTVHWSSGSSGIDALAPVYVPPYTIRADIDGPREDFGIRRDVFAVGTLGVLSQVVGGLRALPGRKSLVFFSEGFPLVSRARIGGGGRTERRDLVVDAIERLVDAANRASIVFYSIEARGVATTGLTAVDDLADVMQNEGTEGRGVLRRLGNRSADFTDSQDSLKYLAQNTGGLFMRSNDVGQGLQHVLDDQQGFYLIGYRPNESTVDAKTGERQFHAITVRVKRPGLHVRSRNGFLGPEGQGSRVVHGSRSEQMVGAMASPFAAGGVHVRLTPLFGNNERTGSFVRLLLHIDARDLSFSEEAGGGHKAVMDVMAVIIGYNERAVDRFNRTETIRVRGDYYKLLNRDGLIYYFNVPVKRAGAYQLRVAVRDAVSERVGSASQFITVPDLDKEYLAISGLIINGSTGPVDGAASASAPGGLHSASPNIDGAHGVIEEINAQASPAVRHFRQGMAVEYRYVIYNARIDPATRHPRLTVQTRLFHDGQQVFAAQPSPFNTDQQTDLKRLMAGGRLRLGAEVKPGQYVLQVVVTDSLGKEPYRTVTQWTDLEIH